MKNSFSNFLEISETASKVDFYLCCRSCKNKNLPKRCGVFADVVRMAYDTEYRYKQLKVVSEIGTN